MIFGYEKLQENGEPIENFKTQPLFHLEKKNVNKLDVKGDEKKHHMCTGIARYYIKVAHLFAAINKTVNPMISWKNAQGKQLTPVMNKSDIPKGVRSTLSKLNFLLSFIYLSKSFNFNSY